MIEIRNGKTLGSYKRLPNRKKQLITKEFCEDFKTILIERAIENDKNRGHEIDYTKECYMGFFGSIQGLYLFYEALKDVCIKHNVVKAIYEYAKRMNWYDSDCFDDDLILRMVELDVIPYSTIEWETNEEFIYSSDEWIDCYIVRHYKDRGYTVITPDKWYKDDKISLEDIYKDDPKVKIVWSE